MLTCTEQFKWDLSWVINWLKNWLILSTLNPFLELHVLDFFRSRSVEDIDPNKLTAVNLQILRNLWLPDVEILNLKAFETHSVLSKLEGIWIDVNHNFIYVLAARITFLRHFRCYNLSKGVGRQYDFQMNDEDQ